MDELEKFLKFLYETDTGYVYSPLKTKTGEWITKFFQWPSQQQELTDWIRLSSESGNVYIAPALFYSKEAKKENILHSNVAWVEFDGKRDISFLDIPEPDVIIQTSREDHLHCYWKIKPTNVQVLEDINRRLTYHLGADSSGWDANQVLRPPGTTNWKHSLPVTLKKLQAPLFKHKLEVFDSAPEIKKPPVILQYEDLEAPELILARKNFPKELETMVLREIAVEPHRSTFLMRAGYLLASGDCTEEEIISLLYHIDSRIKKFTGRSDQLLRLGEIASLAILDATKSLHIEGYSPLEILSDDRKLEWYIEGWLHRNGILLISGAPGTGKTQFSFDLAYRLTTGDSVLGKPAVEPLSVAFLSLEMEIIELKYIVEHQVNDWREKQFDLYNANFRAYAPDEERSFSAYERILSTYKPKVFIIDSLSELAEDDLKESEARVIMGWVRKIRKEYDCAVILIHHNRKASDGNKRPRKLSDLYGSYIFGKLSETVISLWDLEKDNLLDIDIFKVRFGPRTSYRIRRSPHLTFEKVDVSVNVSGQSRKATTTIDFLRFVSGSDSD